MGELICKKCGHKGEPSLAESGPHTKASCGKCGEYIAMVPKPWTDERAEKFLMGFGKHAGKTIGEIVKIDPDYARWAAKNMDKNAGQAFRHLLRRG